METLYLIIVVFLLVLAIFDLFVGVSNDAVNFLTSAVGAKVAKFRTVLIVASCGVLIGSVMSSGMMDIARHGIMWPEYFSFHEVLVIFLASMVADIIILDTFNSMGLPTSTTVSLVFEILGAAFAVALIKIIGSDGASDFDMYLNSDKALTVIIAIFVSVAIAFLFGLIVQWISRLIFTFNYTKRLRYTVAVFGGISFTALAYFIFIKGIGKSPYISEDTRNYINDNTLMLMSYTFVCSTVVMQFLHLLRINIFKIIVLLGTFALAMAFAGNDLVNFIGRPLTGLDAYNDYVTNGLSSGPHGFMMESLMGPAGTEFMFLFIAGIIMVVAMCTSKKAQNVVKTSVDLSRQDEGDEMFGTSKAARSLVRATQESSVFLSRYVPKSVGNWIDKRFNKEEVILEEGAAFDIIRASVNLVLAAMLIALGTSMKLPLSTTYVTFMVAMGTSLADRAWSRESAVYRITGVISVIGGWFITAGVAFVASGLICVAFFYGGFPAMFVGMGLVAIQLIRSNMKFHKESKGKKENNVFKLMMRTRDPEVVWDLLTKHISSTQSFVNRFALEQYDNILDGLANEKLGALSVCQRELKNEQDLLKKYRRQELLALRRVPINIAVERNTWYHLGINSDQQFVYCLKRMLEPIKEHVDNNFNPLPQSYLDEFAPMRQKITELMDRSYAMLVSTNFEGYDSILNDADSVKDELSVIRKHHYDRMQSDGDTKDLKISLVYLNIIQESQEFLSIMRHQLRAASRFYGN